MSGQITGLTEVKFKVLLDLQVLRGLKASVALKVLLVQLVLQA
jgi:hypothetical protein